MPKATKSDKTNEPIFEPDPEVLAKFPNISGNTVNGLGEAKPRRPNPFFWHPPDRQTHGELREFVMESFVARREGGRDWGDVGDNGPDLIVKSPNPEKKTAEEWSELIQEMAVDCEADISGITEMDPLWVYKSYEISEPTLIVMGFAQDY